MKILLMILTAMLLTACTPGVEPVTVQPEITPSPIEEYTAPTSTPTAPKYASDDVELEYLGTYTLYAYCPCVKCCGKTNGITASGTKAERGRTVAANLPFGTVIKIDGVGERVVEDRGGGIGDREMDIFMESHEEALQFGKRRAEVWR